MVSKLLLFAVSFGMAQVVPAAFAQAASPQAAPAFKPHHHRMD